MANKAISELPQAQNVNNQDLFVLEQGGIAKKLTAETFITEQGIIDALAEALDGHGGIQSVTLASVSGRIRTYRITFSDGSATTFQVYDGTSIERISRTSSSGLQDTYTIFMSDGTTTFFTVTNGADGTVSEAMLNDALKDKAPAVTETTESSAIATFPDGADDMVMHNVIVEIDPVQSGSGDPSPSNIRPISGWTGCNVTRTGKNLLRVKYPGRTNNGVTYVLNSDGTISLSGTATASSYFASNYGFNTNYMTQLKAGTYTISGGSESVRVYGSAFTKDGTWLNTITQDTGHGSTFTYNEDFWFSPQIYVLNGTDTTGIVLRLQIEAGSTTTAYEPYTTPTTVSLSWQTEAGTVYGGTVDVATGLLTVTHKMWTADGTVPWTVNGEEGTAEASFYTGIGYGYDSLAGSSNGYSNYFKYRYSFGTRGTIMAYTNRIHLNSGSGFTTRAELQAAFAETPLQVLYPIAQPQTYQLTGQQLMTLLGNNSVWADTGNISVTYPADTKMYIQNLTQPTEDDLVANQAITSGKYFMIGNSLYLALANIASGAQITIGTNAQRVSLADALNNINS